ncbi:AbrB/MazE/SpoVT family DNA-binding domain-containing protein [Candidatus Kaiserbacteria bacterium]|nr:AbrB/MazE/SpoVT family DNA-binding domain-containing protein [Candidatus Kaiserbacteria bacterium]
MTQKVLKVGSSAAVTIPKKSLAELGLKIGDRVTLTVNREHKSIVVQPSVSVDAETVQWARDFIEKYRSALEALARQ